MKSRRMWMNGCPEGAEDYLKEVLDCMETHFDEIVILLNIESVEDLAMIQDAYECAKAAKDELY